MKLIKRFRCWVYKMRQGYKIVKHFIQSCPNDHYFWLVPDMISESGYDLTPAQWLDEYLCECTEWYEDKDRKIILEVITTGLTVKRKIGKGW